MPLPLKDGDTLAIRGFYFDWFHICYTAFYGRHSDWAIWSPMPEDRDRESMRPFVVQNPDYYIAYCDKPS